MPGWVLRGATAVVTTVHPMSADRDTQHRVGVEGTATLARAAHDAGVDRLVHLSTAAVLGPDETSTWNTLVPASVRDDEAARSRAAAPR